MTDGKVTRHPRQALEIMAIARGSWRVCDTRFPLDSTDGLLAYVEQEPYGFSVMVMRPGRPRTLRAESWEEALSFIEHCSPIEHCGTTEHRGTIEQPRTL